MRISIFEKTRKNQISIYFIYRDKGKKPIWINTNLRLLSLDSILSDVEKRKIIKQNKRIREIANNLRNEKELEIIKGKFGYQDIEKQNMCFIDFFETIKIKKFNSNVNSSKWNTVFKLLKNYSSGKKVEFSIVDKKWLEGFKEYLTKYRSRSKDKKLSINTQIAYFNVVATALKTAIKDGIIRIDPSKEVSRLKYAEVKKGYLTKEEIKLLNETECKDNNVKDAFLFSCLTGIRGCDLITLKINDLQTNSKGDYQISFKQQKTNAQEILPICSDAVSIIKRQKTNPKGYIFSNIKGSGWRNDIIKDWLYKANIQRSITFHCSRHSFAYLQLQSGTSLYTIMKLLGHKNINTTMCYLKLTDKDKIEAVKNINIGLY